MSSDLSDDDRPLGMHSGPSNLSHVRTNGVSNGHAHDEDVSMSEDDDIPLSQSTRVKSESSTPAPRKRKKPVVESSSDDDRPLASSPAKTKARSAALSMPGATAATTVPASLNGRARAAKSKPVAPLSSDSEDDVPLAPKRRATKAPPKKKVKKEESDAGEDSDFDDDRPIAKKAPAKKRKVKEESDADEDEDVKPKKRAPKKAPAKKVKKEEDVEETEVPATPKKKSRVKKEEGEETKSPKKKKKEEEEEDVYKWWEAEEPTMEKGKRWKTLVHSGVLFPPPYEPLPPYVKMKYNGNVVNLPPESEEVAGFYAALLESDHAKDATFNKNFFNDWQTVLKKHPPLDGTRIKDLTLCDFRPMFDYFEEERAKKKALTTAEKKELKAAKDALEAPYATCMLDGRKEKVGNFRVEPPGLFRGRGEHPKKGSLKLRVRPEDIQINIGKGVPIPVPNMPGKWKSVVHKTEVTWLATWTENINGQNKYVFLAANSSVKGQSDMMKFEKARELKKHVDRIRADYTADLKTKVMADRQRATTMYFIDRLALRAGNEKGEDEADTVGCCSLRCEHITLETPDQLVFDFLGKDSIRYYNRVSVDIQVFKNIRIFKQNKEDEDSLFDRVNTTALNKHLQSYMKGLTAKVFRTYNASQTFQKQLDEGTPDKGTVQEKLNAYNHANRMVAILCNHQRAVPKTHDASMQKMRDKIRGMKYERMKLRHALFTIDPKYKKKAEYKELESDIDDDWIVEHEEEEEKKAIERAEKKFQKENEKLVADGEKEQDDGVLKERVKAIKDEFKQLKKERGTQKHELKRERPTDKLEEQIEKLDERVKTAKLQMHDRDAGKEVALGTSKINYLDPRITAAWCAKHDVPIERIFSKTLIKKFPWAMDVDEDWKF